MTPNTASVWTTLAEKLCAWAGERDDIEGILLVGSHARGTARPDSDIDLVILARDPESLRRNSLWITRFGEVVSTVEEDWGRLKSLRVRYEGDLEVEFGVTDGAWAAREPIDSGTARVVAGGAQVVWDPTGDLKIFLEYSASSR